MSDVLAAIYRGDREEAARLAGGKELDVFEAAALGRTGRLEELLDADASLANAWADDGFQPLGLASFFGHVDGPALALTPVTAASAPVVLGNELRDLGAAVAVRVVRALGGSVDLDGETLTVRLPQ